MPPALNARRTFFPIAGSLLWFRFEWQGAAPQPPWIANVHDIVLAIVLQLSNHPGSRLDLTTIQRAPVLTILGYSRNDTS